MASNTEHLLISPGISRQRVLSALQHAEPDRVPVDFLATPEVWEKLIRYFGTESAAIDSGGFFSPAREAVLRALEVDCRVLSYDMFCNPPAEVLLPGAGIDWWNSPVRSTPNRMWRQVAPDGTSYDIWGHHTSLVHNPTGSYEEIADCPLQHAATLAELSRFNWPQPDWWDFSRLADAAEKVNPQRAYHLRLRVGSVFENAWQLRGMEQFLVDLAADPQIPVYIMDRLSEVIVENTRCMLEQAGDWIDMLYFYDDVGAQEGLMISKSMWRRLVRPQHQKIIDMAHRFGKPVMYHTDGAVYPLIQELIELGIDVLDPIQPTAKNMAPAALKQEFGQRLSFHGGIDIVGTLPRGRPEDVAAEVRERVDSMGVGGGYILSSSHHIQPDTPLENVLALYQPGLRIRAG